jgi:osmoprotectant transport system substrate-binding protein
VVVGRTGLGVGFALLALGACAAADDEVAPHVLDDDAITVGSFAFPESVLLAELYSQALEAEGFRVDRAFGLGPREFVGPALDAGLVELVPEYAGTALAFRSVASIRPTTEVDTTRRRLTNLLAGTAIMVLESAPAQNANTFVVTRATARRHDLARLSDLRDVADELTFGGPAECPRRPLCLLGLQERYGLRFDEVLALDSGGAVTHQALRGGGVHVALLFTTDPDLDEYVELADDEGLQPAENVTPLIRREVVERWGPGVIGVIDAVSRRLRTDTLRQLNAADAVEPGSADVAAIVADWLTAEDPP